MGIVDVNGKLIFCGFLMLVLIFSISELWPFISAQSGGTGLKVSSKLGVVQMDNDVYDLTYPKNLIVKVYGVVNNVHSVDRVIVIFTLPDGSEKGTETPTTKDGYFETFLQLDSTSQLGQYKLFASYQSDIIGSLSFTVTKSNIPTSVPPTNTPSNTSPTYSIKYIIVSTDRSYYNSGDIIRITGETRDYISGVPITIKITNPIGNVVAISQVELGTDKTFSAQIVAGGAPWKASGTYTVDVQYGSKDKSAKTTFEFSGSAGGAPSGKSIQVKNTDFSVTYGISGGKVLGIEADVQSKSLRISLQTTSDGVLTITLPRALIDAKIGGQDDQFFVLIDGAEEVFEETTTSTDRTLTIHFSNGAGEIEIIGTQIETKQSSKSSAPSHVNTHLYLDVRDSSNPKYIQVYTALTYGSGTSLSSKDIRIYVDNMDKGTVNSDEWSSDIWAGFGTHEIKAIVQDFPDKNDNSIIHLGSSSSKTYFVKQPTISNPNPITNPNTATTDNTLIYAIIGVVLATVGIVIGLAKHKKSKPIIKTPISKPTTSPVITPIRTDDTQFYVCPHCGNDTQIRYGKQYCSRCKRYLES